MIAAPAFGQGGEVIDVYLMGGQSNMQGVGRNNEVPEGYLPQDSVQLYHSASTSSPGGANQWHTNQPNGYTSGHFGPEIGLGHQLLLQNPDASVALIKHASGGTDLAEDWDPGTFGQSQTYGPQYQTFVNTVTQGLQQLAVENPDAEIRLVGMFWQQGEQDSKFDNMSSAYGENLSNLIVRVREEFDTPGLTFVYGTVHDVVGNEVPSYVYNDRIIEAQHNIDQDSGHALAVSGAHVVDSSAYLTHGDLQDGFRDTDYAHFASDALIDLGEAYASSLAEALSLRGDFNGDRFVGIEDMDILLAHWGDTGEAGPRWTTGDANGDGLVDQGDLQIVLDHWGRGTPPETAIPEPASALSLGGLLMLCMRRGAR